MKIKRIASGEKAVLSKIRELIGYARKAVSRQIDNTMCLTYFLIGRYIIEDEQQGKKRAAYSEETLHYLAKELTLQFGRGFSARNLANMKKFYLTYQSRLSCDILQTLSAKSPGSGETDILQTLSAKLTGLFMLSWSHYLLLCRIDNEAERDFYEIESRQNIPTRNEFARKLRPRGVRHYSY
ncbi:MAG TPA: DUF1016 N-terminal domain-containing protein [Bacteroidales bacterium]|nr:DUF1016 N-terminal domain-containing protein [Bacteroidales bacterium]